MLKNFIIIAFRNLTSRSVFSLINIIGLALGMAACLVIFRYVFFEYSYDQFHNKKDQIYRLALSRSIGEEDRTFYTAPMPVKSVLDELNETASVARFVNINYQNNSLVYKSPQHIKTAELAGVFYVDSTFAEMFDFELLSGAVSPISQVGTCLITQSVAEKLFESPQQAVGKSVDLSGNIGSFQYEIAGVLANPPKNSHFDFEVLLSMPSYVRAEGEEMLTGWGSFNGVTFIEVKGKTDVKAYEKLLTKTLLGEPVFGNENETWRLSLDPITDLHFSAQSAVGFKPSGNEQSVKALAIVALFILIIALVNYINLSTAIATERAREVGVRKTLGSSQWQLRWQFIFESILINVIAAGVALTLVQLSLPFLSGFTNPLEVADSHQWMFWGLIVGVFIFGAILSGIYPAFVLSSYNPTQIISGKVEKRGNKMSFRKLLVVFQFAASIILIAGTFIIYNQLNYMKSQDLGLNIDDVIVLNPPPGSIVGDNNEFFTRVDAFKTAVSAYPFVQSMTKGSAIPGERITWGTSQIRRKNDDSRIDKVLALIAMDRDYLKTFDIPIIAGDYYREGQSTFGNGDFIINKKASDLLGFASPEAAIGEKLYGGGMFPELTIVGVTADIHHRTLAAEKAALGFVLSAWSNYYAIKLNIDEQLPAEQKLAVIDQAIDALEGEWKKNFDGAPFDFFFLDKAFNDQYKSDQEFGFIFSLFAGLAIIIGCLGLLGLSAYSITRRTKEIGIRKVLGASMANLTVLLSKEYLLLILIAGIVGAPVAYYFFDKWLENYAYRTQLDWWIFALPIAIVLSIALATILVQVVKAGKRNPVESLRSE
ncbi:ABC transporter permease [Fulvivirga sp. RKSG066]|uniref:ABC transporter permease n=1 Tax=Fulvivirga aurantia TaxID=2529383 RepID=UPI0012BB7D27|nr:ABC transporter permease [Fulvivirga aurantia]MTI21421.1 ABC transporter permease [Fulvivirga aurantia]